MRTNLLTTEAHLFDALDREGPAEFRPVMPNFKPTWRFLLDQFCAALELSPSQLVAIGPALDRAGAQFSEIRFEATRTAKAVIDETVIAIRPSLSEHQREILDTWQQIEAALRHAPVELDRRSLNGRTAAR